MLVNFGGFSVVFSSTDVSRFSDTIHAVKSRGLGLLGVKFVLSRIRTKRACVCLRSAVLVLALLHIPSVGSKKAAP